MEIFKKFGEERFSNLLAAKIIEARQGTILATAGEFKDVIHSAFPKCTVAERNQSTKRAFQAIRIAVNQEFLSLATFLDNCPRTIMDTRESRRMLKKSAMGSSMLMVITFHSLEERMVSQAMARWRKAKLGDVATKKPVEPSEDELEENSKSRSAKLWSFMFD